MERGGLVWGGSSRLAYADHVPLSAFSHPRSGVHAVLWETDGLPGQLSCGYSAQRWGPFTRVQGSCSGDAQLNREGHSREGRAGTHEQGFTAALTLKGDRCQQRRRNGGDTGTWRGVSEAGDTDKTGREGRDRARGPARQAASACPAVESHRAFSRVPRQQVTLTGRQ